MCADARPGSAGLTHPTLTVSDLNPYLKLLGMLVGLGASATLPSVITGYLGNPWGKSEWIESSLAQGQKVALTLPLPLPLPLTLTLTLTLGLTPTLTLLKAGRWPDVALELDSAGATVCLK